MQPKRLRGLHERERVDDAGVDVPVPGRRYDVVHPDALVSVKMKRLERVKEEIAEVLVEVGVQHAAIEGIRDAAAVHRLADEVAQRAPRQRVVAVVVRLREVRVDEQVRDAEIRLVEVVRHVPPEFAVLAPLLRDGVEKRQHVRQRAVPGMRAVAQRALGDFRVRRAHVQLQTVRGLRDDFQRPL